MFFIFNLSRNDSLAMRNLLSMSIKTGTKLININYYIFKVFGLWVMWHNNLAKLYI